MIPYEEGTSSRSLVDVAMGRQLADMVIRNGQWLCVQSGEILPGTDIAVAGERIAYVGPDASHTIGPNTRVIQANGRYLSPGFLDGHMHVESGMLTVTEFVRAVIAYGTTGMFIDPHEIANVFGLPGLKLIVDEAAIQPIHVWVQVPSCVPSAPGFETPGAELDVAQVAEAMKWDGVIGLGEMMNYSGVARGDEKYHAEMANTRQAGKVIGGHYPSRDLGQSFHGYVAGGAQDDHEGTSKEDALVRIRQGMKVMLRFGSGWLDIAEGARAITENGLDSRHFILCTDDSHSETLVNEGHVSRAIKQAISHKIPPLTAIQMATLNTAEHFGVSHDVGMIAPGRFADILILSDLRSLVIDKVIAKGRIIVEKGRNTTDLPVYHYPEWATRSVNIGRSLTPADFHLEAPPGKSFQANVIGIIEDSALTKHLRTQVNVEAGAVNADVSRDIAKVAVVDRHHRSGRVKVGLVQGFNLQSDCAIASTVAHDSHNMIVVGTSDIEMSLAANKLARLGGGQVVVKKGQVIGQVALPIAGLVSTATAPEVASQVAGLLEAFRQCGCHLHNPNMQLSLLALVVIPELRISDLGLVDVQQFKFIPVLESR